MTFPAFGFRFGFAERVCTKHLLRLNRPGPVATELRVAGFGIKPAALETRPYPRTVLENLKTAPAAAGVGFDSVVHVNYYLVDVTDAPVMREVRAGYIASEFPASSLLEVKRLAREEFRLEIDAIAVAPE